MSNCKEKCGTCKHWGEKDGFDKGETYRKCEAVIDKEDILPSQVKGDSLAVTLSDYHSGMYCREDFGCVMHEPKEGPRVSEQVSVTGRLLIEKLDADGNVEWAKEGPVERMTAKPENSVINVTFDTSYKGRCDRFWTPETGWVSVSDS